jgi:ribonuclease HI
MEGWLKNGWTKSDGQPVLNVDILQKILPLYRMYKDRIDLEYVAAHVGHAENEIADSLAKAGARKENIQQHI